MASPLTELKGDLHIAPCSRDRCQAKIIDLADELAKRGLMCISNYGLTGLYATRFKQAFEGCPYTIVHKCKKLWEKISDLEEELLADSDKIVTVVLSEEHKYGQDGRDSRFNKFFDKYLPKNATYDSAFKTFVKELQTLPLLRSSDSEQRNHQSISRQNTHFLQRSSPDETDEVTNEESTIFEVYRNLPTQISIPHIRKEYLLYASDEAVSNFSAHSPAQSLKTMLKINEMTELPKEKHLSVVHQILHDALPTCYQDHNVVGVACIACCHHPVLQQQATELLALMLLNTGDEERQISISTMCLVETLLYDAVCTEISKEQQPSVTIHQLSSLYMIILSDMILTCKEKEIGKCKIHLQTIGARPLPVTMKVSGVDALNYLQKFIQQTTSQGPIHWRKEAQSYLSDNPSQQGAALSKRKIATQVIVIFQVLKKLFRSLDLQDLQFLLSYTERKCANSQLDSCIWILTQSMTLFLTVRLKEAGSKDLSGVCETSMKIIELLQKWDLTKEMMELMETLYFVSNRKIRKGIIQLLLTNQNGEKAKCYRSKIRMYLVNHVERLLIPFLTFDSSKDAETEYDWIPLSGQFGNQDMRMQLHIPTEEHHIERNKTEFTRGEDLSHNEMMVLQNLHHKNIIKMLAYQGNVVPQFYITENDQSTSLQVALKNKRANQDNQQYYDKSTLLQFLLDAIAAVEYCHEKGYVHRNLTCASLFIAKNNVVKLSGFHFCLKLIKGKGRADEQAFRKLPVRWTAPESIRHGEFTTASDVWMFGHMMYETLTHGQLPYGDIERDDELTKKISEGEPHLSPEPCIVTEHRHLIFDCAHIDPKERVSVVKIKTQLQNFHKAAQHTADEVEYPGHDHSFKPSTDHQKGIPDVNVSGDEDNQIHDGEQLIAESEHLTRKTQGDKYVFVEKINHKVPDDFLIKIEDGELKEILPDVKIDQKRSEVPHIICETPSSCQGNLQGVAAKKTLGENLAEYLKCLHQVAVIMHKLHKKSWVLGDVCASHVYVEHQNNNVKVHLVSLAYLRPLESNFYDRASKDSRFLERTAPEVVQGGILSPASDIYCFGNLMWEVLKAFDEGYETTHKFDLMDDSTGSILENEYKKKNSNKWETTHKKPKCCSDDLYELMKLCMNFNDNRRIKIDQLVDELQRTLTEDPMLQDKETTEIMD